jgi:hypothetical protein
VFRGPDGLMCAAGCLVPDADYDPDWEQDGEIDGSSGYLNPVSRYFFERGFDLELLKDLQAVHDLADVADWPAKLENVAP